ncbi:MAG TPA: lactate utilization protein [Candidatus Paceibacterota bacterium]|nr:lactate utilization protein [Candidatus Paceibacterota bacterium]
MTYDTLASDDAIVATISALKERGIEAEVVNTRGDALAKVKELIPAGASVNNGSSTTLQEIGLVDYLKGETPWVNLHAKVLAESDPAKQKQLRQEAYFADYYLGSVHALAQTGEMVIASNTSSQLPPLLTTSQNVILVVSTQKIMPTLNEALARLREYVVPLEDARMKSTGASGTILSKIVIFEKEPAFMGRKVCVIFIKEKLGF